MRNYQNIFMKSDLTAAAVVLLTGTALADFTDAASITHPEAVTALMEKGVINGKPDGSFDPAGAVLRSEMAKMLSILVDPDGGESPSSGFTDVPNTWAERYIDHCYSMGLISGRGDGTFDPGGTVTGTETAKMVLAAAGYDTTAFTGTGWAAKVDNAAAEAGLYANFTAAPSARLTRDGAALLLYNGLSLLTDSRERVQVIGGLPTGLAVMEDGSLLLTDAFTRTVFRLRGGKLETYAGAVTGAADVNGRPLGGYYDGGVKDSTFKLPWAAAPFLDGWAVSDAENNVVRLIQDGQVQTLNPSISGGSQKALSYPTGLAAGPDGSLYVSDTHNGLIRRIASEGTMDTVAQGLQDPMGLCWYNGSLYIAETGANRIVRLKDGKIHEVAGSGEEGYADGSVAEAQFSNPKALTISKDGVIYVSDTGNSAIRVIRSGQVTTLTIRDPADAKTSCPVSPVGLALLGGKLYMCDDFTGVLAVFDAG